jgi:hypothetical protein
VRVDTMLMVDLPAIPPPHASLVLAQSPRASRAGYVILDPETGAGAWKIAGGANGGQTDRRQRQLEAAYVEAETRRTCRD